MSQRKNQGLHKSSDTSQKGKGKSSSTETEGTGSYNTNSEDWCQVCALHIDNCRCPQYKYGTTPSSWQSLGPNSNTTVADPSYFDPNSFTWNAGISDPSYGGFATYSTTPGQTGSYSIPVSPQAGTTWNNHPTSPPVSSSRNQGSATGSDENANQSRERKLKQNRNSQRKFRLNQMKVVEDLKEKVEDLKSKNQKLSKKVSSLDKGQMYHVTKVPNADAQEGGLSVLEHAGTDQFGGYVMSWGDEDQ